MTRLFAEEITEAAEKIAQDAANNSGSQPQPGGSMFGMLFPFIMMFGVIYLLMIRPQQKQRKEHQKMIDSLQEYDKVVTQSGIIGKITNIKDNIIVLRIDENTNTKIEVMKTSVVSILTNGEEDAK